MGEFQSAAVAEGDEEEDADWEQDRAAEMSSAGLQVDASLCRVRDVFSAALQHHSPKPVQTAVSSMQNLLQHPTCGVMLTPVILPCLLSALSDPASKFPESTLESAWGVVSAIAANQQANAGG